MFPSYHTDFLSNSDTKPLESRNWIEPCSFFTRKIISTLPVPWLFGSFLSAIQRSQVKPGENETICVNPFSVKEVFDKILTRLLQEHSIISSSIDLWVVNRLHSSPWFRFGSAVFTGFENRLALWPYNPSGIVFIIPFTHKVLYAQEHIYKSRSSSRWIINNPPSEMNICYIVRFSIAVSYFPRLVAGLVGV